ncbi:hypothetical protein KRR40_39120 [Niabella defluvii]|nr:hypothetical protein KRR40_39120 [Niabella sp. I65]
MTKLIIERSDHLLKGLKLIASKQAERETLKQQFSELLNTISPSGKKWDGPQPQQKGRANGPGAQVTQKLIGSCTFILPIRRLETTKGVAEN